MSYVCVCLGGGGGGRENRTNTLALSLSLSHTHTHTHTQQGKNYTNTSPQHVMTFIVPSSIQHGRAQVAFTLCCTLLMLQSRQCTFHLHA